MILTWVLCYIDEVDSFYNYRDDDTEHMLLPESYRRAREFEVLENAALPRRHREATEWYGKTFPIQSLIEVAKQRTRRLLRSLDELEREVWGSASQKRSITSQAKIDADPHWYDLDNFGDIWWERWEKTLGRARRAQVTENELTEEFREARRIGLDSPRDLNSNAPCDKRNWPYYQLHRDSRNKWGQYLRSNVDWDWDLGSCMRRLLENEKQTE